ncbi:MAG: hypothetical protein HRU41_20170 [Saprospiraceae bacterium]|nr:hypothetical protein [Saprospiraceae bacterium]
MRSLHIFPAALFLLLIAFSACDKSSNNIDGDDFRSELTFDLDGERYAFVQEGQDQYDVTYTSKAQIGGPDSARINIRKGLGEAAPNGQMPRNALYISFNIFSNGFYISFDQLQDWTRTGLRDFVRDGNMETGIGLIWIDDQQEVWSSGSTIGEFSYTEGVNLSLDVLPEASQFQTDSRFSITSSKRIEPQAAHAWARQVDIEFNARLYNAAGERMDINNGLFQTRIDVYN